MTFSISPAVTFTEVDATGSVPAVSYTEGAIAGVFNWGPVLQRTLVPTETHLVETFYKPSNRNAETFFTAASYLAYSAGLYVVRVVSDEAMNAGAAGAILTREDAEAYTGAAIIGRYPGALANDLEVSYVTNATAFRSDLEKVWPLPGTNTVRVFDATGNTVTVGDLIELGDDITGKQVLRVTGKTSGSMTEPTPVPAPKNATVTLVVAADTETVVQLDRENRYEVGEFIQISGAAGITVLNGTWEVLAVNGRNVTLDLDTDGETAASYTANSGKAKVVNDPNWTPASVTAYTLTLNGRYALPISNNYITAARRWGYSNVIGTAPAANEIHLVVVDKVGNITGVPNTVLESFPSVSLVEGAKLDDGSRNFYKDVINGRSKWIYTTADTIAPSTEPVYNQLSGGVDGDDEATISLGELAQGYDLFRGAEDVNVSFIMQGKARAGVAETGLANYLIENVAHQRRDCIVTISPGQSAVVNNRGQELAAIKTFRDAINSSSYWFADSGYKYMYDKYNDVHRWVPLNGDTAGLMAACLPWESPAGYNRGFIKNVAKLAFNPAAKAARDVLFGMDINPVMSQVGQGTLLFGDKTGHGANSAFNAVLTRRLLIYIEKAIATFSARILFENNNEFTQAKFRNGVEPFLRDIKGQGGLIDFRVECGPSVNTPEVIDQYMFRGNVFLKVPRAIRHIDLKFIPVKTGVEFEEYVGMDF